MYTYIYIYIYIYTYTSRPLGRGLAHADGLGGFYVQSPYTYITPTNIA